MLRMALVCSNLNPKYTNRFKECPQGNRRDALAKRETVHIEFARELAGNAYAICAGIWKDRPRTPDFLRTVLNNAILPEIERGIRSAKRDIMDSTNRPRSRSNVTAVIQKLARDGRQLKNDWRTRIGMEVQEVQLARRGNSVQVIQTPDADDVPKQTFVPPALTSDTELTDLTPPDLPSELQRLEKRRDRLTKQFPHLAQLQDTPSVISQYDAWSHAPERVLFYGLTRRIRSLKVELLQRDEALDEHSAEACDDPPQAQVRRQAGPFSDFTHTTDFRTLTFSGQTHVLTQNQAIVVGMLHEAWSSGTPELGHSHILENLRATASRLRDTFKRSPLWGVLVIPGRKRGTVRLNLPDPPSRS